MKLTEAERAAVRRFHEALGKRCADVSMRDNCMACDMRLYCYTPPKEITAGMVDRVVDFISDREEALALVREMDRDFRTE